MLARILKDSRYGRCVYRCPENEVSDYESVRIEMGSGIKAKITMECTTEESNRLTVIECENAVITGDEEQVVVKYINGQPDETYDFNWTKPLLFHSGADLLIIKEFIETISKGHLHTRTSCNTSLVSHKICFLAE